MTNSNSNREIVLSVIARELGIEINSITDDSRFKEDLGSDSLDVVQIIIGIEESLSRDLPDSLFDGVRTVKDLMGVIESDET